MSYGILVQGLKMSNLVDEYKIIFLGKRSKRWNFLETFFLYLSFQWFFLKSVKSLNRTLWTTESWLKLLKCQTWLTNTKPFFWESEANVNTLQRHSPYIWVSYKSVFKSVKSLKPILWTTEYWLKVLKYQTCFTNTKSFLWKSEANIETF